MTEKKREKTGLTVEDSIKIRNVFTGYPNIEKVILYGSRAMGTFKPASDIDLTLIGENLTNDIQSRIEWALDDILLPYHIDISLFNTITNPALIDHIQRVGKEFYSRASLNDSTKDDNSNTQFDHTS
jgi:predicted nucleotidyltransferase